MTFDDECIHGLTSATCSICKPRDSPTPTAQRRRSKTRIPQSATFPVLQATVRGAEPSWVTHDQLVAALLKDQDIEALIADASSDGHPWSPSEWAGNAVAFFHKAWTEDHRQFPGLERQGAEGGYCYRYAHSADE